MGSYEIDVKSYNFDEYIHNHIEQYQVNHNWKNS